MVGVTSTRECTRARPQRPSRSVGRGHVRRDARQLGAHHCRMSSQLESLCARHDVLVRTDNPFQRRARALQAVWRQAQGLPTGEHGDRPLGSRLAMLSARDHLTNYLTEPIRDVVRREVVDPVRSRGKLYARPRIFNDLLSSQPLCFNLFGELQQNLPLARRALRRVTDGRIETVTAIGFEHSPGRRDATYTGDRSAFDVFVEYATPDSKLGFAGIEVKYHENLDDKAAPHRERYEEIAAAMGCFLPGARATSAEAASTGVARPPARWQPAQPSAGVF